MSEMSNQNLQKVLDTLREKNKVVGASLSVLHTGQIQSVSSGILNLNTNVDVTNGSLFQIGSISKVFTTTLVMQLVDEGKIELDEPVIRYLPSFRLADMQAAKAITVRHLLCHISGMDGDYFPDDDPFNPSIEKYVERCSLLPQLHPVGQYISYSNSAFTLAGRLIEVIENRPWSKVLESRILTPLEMTESVADPVEMLRFRGAIGHIPQANSKQKWQVTPQTYLPLGLAPAGTVLSMSARDLLKFVIMHMKNGVNAKGEQILSAASVKAMQQSQFSLPPYPKGITDWGLGWFLTQRPGMKSFGHTGGTSGQFSYLSVFPNQDFAYVLLTNSNSAQLYVELEKVLLDKYTDMEQEPEPVVQDIQVNHARYIGTYSNIAAEVNVTEKDGQLCCVLSDNTEQPMSLPIAPVGEDSFVASMGEGMPSRGINFIDEDKHGRSVYFFTGGRMLRRKQET